MSSKMADLELGTPSIQVEIATRRDMVAVTDIYAYHVLNGLGTFEEEPPTVAEMSQRYQKVTTNHYPFLVAKLADKVIAYAYAGPFRERAAYRFSVEDSIYIAAEFTGYGVGKLLLSALITECKAAKFCEMFAVIGDSNNLGSINLHKKFGFQLVGVMRNAGYKFNQWVDVVILQLSLN